MAHMVIFQGSDGATGYEQCESIEDAVKFVEELRNDQGVERARIFRMDEVEFEFRPYYFVVQRAAGEGDPAGSPESVEASSSEPEVASEGEGHHGPPVGESAASAEPVFEPEPEDEPDAAPPAESFTPPTPPPPAPPRGLFGR